MNQAGQEPGFLVYTRNQKIQTSKVSFLQTLWPVVHSKDDWEQRTYHISCRGTRRKHVLFCGMQDCRYVNICHIFSKSDRQTLFQTKAGSDDDSSLARRTTCCRFYTEHAQGLHIILAECKQDTSLDID